MRYWFTNVKEDTMITPYKKHDKHQNFLTVGEAKKVELLTLTSIRNDNKKASNVGMRVAVPRADLLVPKFLVVKVKWTFDTSVFKDYRRDTEAMLDACFDFDWRCSRIPKILTNLTPDKVQVVYRELRKFYPMIKAVYRHYSSLAPAAGIVPCLGSSALTDIIHNSPDLLDRVNLNLAKVDLQFVSTNASKVQIKDVVVIRRLNPDKFIVRYQFLELLVHLARERHFLPGIKGKTTASLGKQRSPKAANQLDPILKVDQLTLDEAV